MGQLAVLLGRPESQRGVAGYGSVSKSANVGCGSAVVGAGVVAAAVVGAAVGAGVVAAAVVGAAVAGAAVVVTRRVVAGRRVVSLGWETNGASAIRRIRKIAAVVVPS